MTPDTRLPVLIRLASLLVPKAYRAEILADLTESAGGAPCLSAVLRSARDARRQLRSDRPGWSAHHLRPDVHGAWRALRAAPASSVTMTMILGAALALSAALGSVVHAVLFRPLPYPDTDRLLFVWSATEASTRDTLSPARALDVRRGVAAFSDVAFIGHLSMTVTGRSRAERWFGASVSANFFDTVGTKASVGRTFSAHDSDRDVVVLSDSLWRDRFGGDPSVIGSRITMNGRVRTIVGVMSEHFYWPAITADTSAENPPLFWTAAPHPDIPERTLVFDEDITQNRTMGFLRVVARLGEGQTTADAEQQTSALASRLAAAYPQTDGGRGFTLVDARTQLLGPVRRPLQLVLIASVLLVLAACVNAGCLLLVRLATRHRELAVRTALGATRSRIVRMLVLEAAIIAGAAGLVGLGGSQLLVRLIASLAPSSVGRLESVELAWPVIGMASLAMFVVMVVLGGLSGVAFWRERAAQDLRAHGAGAGRQPVRQWLVAAESAVAATLLAGAALFAQNLYALQRVDVGLNPDHLLTFDMQLGGERAEYQRQQLDFYDRFFEQVRAMPGVVAASGALTLPIGGDDFGATALPEGQPFPEPGDERRVGFQIVWDGWFNTLGMRLTDGRDFQAGDILSSTPVTIINHTLASQLWPGQSPVGRRVRYTRQPDAPWLTVVGVVSDVRHHGPAVNARPELYLPWRQMTQAMMAVAVRTTGSPLDLMPSIRDAAAAIDPDQPISGVGTMATHLDRTYGRARFLSELTMVFGLSACLLTVLGIYGVTGYAVSQRMREFGVRSALGATPGSLAGAVLRHSLVPVSIGAVVGLATAALGRSAATALVLDSAGSSVMPLLVAAALLLTAATVATLAPARRAARVDPVIALRD